MHKFYSSDPLSIKQSFSKAYAHKRTKTIDVAGYILYVKLQDKYVE